MDTDLQIIAIYLLFAIVRISQIGKQFKLFRKFIQHERLLSDKLALKIEHTHSSYGTEDINTNAAWANSVQEIDFYDYTTHIGLQYRF